MVLDWKPTQRLDIILVKTTFDVFHHETCLSYLRVSNHADFDHHAAKSKTPCLNVVETKGRSVTDLFFSSLFWSKACGFCPLEPGAAEIDDEAEVDMVDRRNLSGYPDKTNYVE